MMIIAFIFEQMFCRFEGAMGFHCNREATKQMTKSRLISAYQSNDRFGIMHYVPLASEA